MENQQNLTMEWHEIPTTNDKMQEKKTIPIKNQTKELHMEHMVWEFKLHS